MIGVKDGPLANKGPSFEGVEILHLKQRNQQCISVHSPAHFLWKVRVSQTTNKRTQGSLGTLNLEVFMRKEKFQVVMNRLCLAWWRGVLTSQAGKGQWFQPSCQRLPVNTVAFGSSPVIVFPFIHATENISYSEDLRSLFPGPSFREEQP